MPGFEPRHGGEISQTGRQPIPDRWSGEDERALTKRFRLRFGILKNLSLENQKVCEVWYVQSEAGRDIIICVYFSVYRCRKERGEGCWLGGKRQMCGQEISCTRYLLTRLWYTSGVSAEER